MENNLPNGNQVLNGGGDDDDPEMDCIRFLLGSEITHPLNDQQAALIINNIWLRQVRNHALRWIFRTTEFLPFVGHTISISIIYLNRFLARQRIQVGMFWKVRLLAIACLSLSAQMDENRINLPRLSEYPVGDYDINVNDIWTMMLIVLNELHLEMSVVTPYTFAIFILSRFNRQISESTCMEITVLILRILRDERSMTQRPSVIAAAAILFGINKNLTRQQLQIEISAMPLNEFLKNDNVWYCYSILWQLNNRHN